MYDLLVSGGTVVDPAQNLSAARDVAISDGHVMAVEKNIDCSSAREVLDASGLLVTPGLVDVHVHVYDGVSHYGIDADTHVLPSGVTTAVDAGSAGADTFGGMRRYVIEASETRIKACLNISSTGMISPVVGELEDIRLIEPDKAIQVCERHRDVIVGVKARLTDFLAGENALPAVRNARVVADAVGLPIMIHPNAPVCTLDEILAEMKAGDLLTHCFHGMDEGILDADGRVRQSVRAAADRGVNLDVGHGQGSFSWTVAESAIAQDLLPATISSDLHAYNFEGPVYDLATTLGKFLQLGMDLDDALRRCTVTPAEILGMAGQIGTLAPGAFADVALFREETGQHVFEDAHGESRIGERRLVPVKVVKGGRVIDAVARAANHHHLATA